MNTVTRVLGAFLRAVLVMALVWLPVLLVPVSGPQTLQAFGIVALVLGGFVFLEYSAKQPSLIDFRHAPPFNRLKFVAVFVILLCASLMAQPQGQEGLLGSLARHLTELSSAEWSPPHLAATAWAPAPDAQLHAFLHGVFAVAQMVGLLTIALFWALLHFGLWPPRGQDFNIWINMPTFEPSCGGDVADRLARDGRINLILGLILPFLLPALLRVVMPEGVLPHVERVHVAIWLVGAWCILPISLILRGMAMGRIAMMIRDQRAARAVQDLAAA